MSRAEDKSKRSLVGGRRDDNEELKQNLKCKI